ncbi:MAG TPA: flagellin [Methanoregulaceae archaeon]|nr:flagellin [Methanoregulaceae archaeon]
MKMSKRNEDAFTGLEAAIVLIAFVVVAAVFSYVVLGAGFFTTQKSQQVVHAGVTQAASNIVVKGNVYGISNDSAHVQQIQFDIGLAAGGLPVDVDKIVYTWSTATSAPTNLNQSTSAAPNSWWIVANSSDVKGSLLQEGQFFTIRIQPTDALNPRDTFNLELKPENGAALGVDRTIPAGITNTTLLY